MTDDDLKAFTTGVVALSWAVAVVTGSIHLFGVYAGFWSHTYLPTYGGTLLAMLINALATIVTIRL
jgi:hypothetical protein